MSDLLQYPVLCFALFLAAFTGVRVSFLLGQFTMLDHLFYSCVELLVCSSLIFVNINNFIYHILTVFTLMSIQNSAFTLAFPGFQAA